MNLPSLEIPAIAELAQRDQWVCWKAVQRDGKTTKIPLMPRGSAASSTDARTWSSFSDACAGVVRGAPSLGICGVGFVLCSSDPYVCVDLDHAIGDDADMMPWAASVIADAPPTYVEVSPSGRGLHVWVRGELPAGWRKHAGVEVYASGRFLTVTGAVYGTCESIADWPDLATWHARLGRSAAPGRVNGAARASDDGALRLDPAASPPAEKLSALLANDRKFRLSWERRRPDLADQSLSTYDLSLASIAVQAAWSDQEICDLLIAFRRSHGDAAKALRPGSGDVPGYCRRTIDAARDGHAAQTTELPELADVAEDPAAALEPVSRTLGVVVRRLRRWGREGSYVYSLALASGEEIALGDAASILAQERVRARLVDAAGLVIPGLKPDRWRKVLGLLLAHVEEIQVEEAGPTQQIAGWIQAYLDQTPPLALAEAIVYAAPFRDESGSVWVAANEIRRFVRRSRGEDLTERQVATRLRMVGCDAKKHTHTERGVRTQRRYWRVLPSLLASAGEDAEHEVEHEVEHEKPSTH